MYDSYIIASKLLLCLKNLIEKYGTSVIHLDNKSLKYKKIYNTSGTLLNQNELAKSLDSVQIPFPEK